MIHFLTEELFRVDGCRATQVPGFPPQQERGRGSEYQLYRETAHSQPPTWTLLQPAQARQFLVEEFDNAARQVVHLGRIGDYF